MRGRSTLAVLITAVALLAPGMGLQAADPDQKKDQTNDSMGEKVDDATITTKVKMKLLGNKATSALNTKVETNDGVVTLTGKAKSSAEKELATKLAEEVNGIKKVNNEMKIDDTEKTKNR